MRRAFLACCSAINEKARVHTQTEIRRVDAEIARRKTCCPHFRPSQKMGRYSMLTAPRQRYAKGIWLMDVTLRGYLASNVAGKLAPLQMLMSGARERARTIELWRREARSESQAQQGWLLRKSLALFGSLPRRLGHATAWSIDPPSAGHRLASVLNKLRLGQAA